MAISDTLNKNRWIVLPIALLALGAGLYLIFAPPRTAPPPVFNFFDLSTGKLVVSEGKEPPEVRANYVDAVVVSCGKCSDASTREVAYIKKPDPNAKIVRLGVPGRDDVSPSGEQFGHVKVGTEGENVLVAKPDSNPAWLKSGDDDGKALVDTAMKCPDGTEASTCVPTK